ncbi:MAG: c-type cytochrome [Magnetococcales bacterium]|nr:c-type cytochrome [Magnetococcales bacterium]NGZ04789.1 c-type cytochrome [Magnetococcales bacterium]
MWWNFVDRSGWLRIGCMLVFWWGQGAAWAVPLLNEPILPVPECRMEDGAKVRLGRQLFHEVRLSANNAMSCATCHPLDQWGMDGIPHSTRADGTLNTMHTPTVFNAVFNLAQFWNGRVLTLEEQVDEAVRVDMGANWNEVVRKLSQEPQYREEFARVYRGGIHAENIRNAIAAFERTLTTPNSRFDRHLRGDESALSKQEKEGYQLFKTLGCISCHQGVNIGGNMFHRFGILGGGGEEVASEPGELDRFVVTGVAEDRHAFKVPGLRNVARTAPYFHHGSVATLDEAVTIMARGQLGYTITPKERTLLVSFLFTLDGETNGDCR